MPIVKQIRITKVGDMQTAQDDGVRARRHDTSKQCKISLRHRVVDPSFKLAWRIMIIVITPNVVIILQQSRIIKLETRSLVCKSVLLASSNNYSYIGKLFQSSNK